MGLCIVLIKKYVNIGEMVSLWERGGMLVFLLLVGVAVFIGITRVINPEEYRALAGMAMRRRKS
jgi:hypothetical protein